MSDIINLIIWINFIVRSYLHYCCSRLCTSPAEGAHAIICQGQSQTISCPKGQFVAVHSSFYGRNDVINCVNVFVSATSNCYADGADDFIMALCDCRPSCTLSASQSIFGNPCLFSNEFVFLQYTCESSQFCNPPTPPLPTTSRTALSASILTTLTSSPTTTTLPKAMTLPTTTTSSSDLTTSITSNSQPQSTSNVKTNLEISTSLTTELSNSMVTSSTKRRENQTTSESSPNTKIRATAFMTKFSSVYTSATTTRHSESNGLKLIGINILWIAVPVGVVVAIVFIVTCALVHRRKTKKNGPLCLTPMTKDRRENFYINGEFKMVNNDIYNNDIAPGATLGGPPAAHPGGDGPDEESAPPSTFASFADPGNVYEDVSNTSGADNPGGHDLPNDADNERTIYDEPYQAHVSAYQRS